jgi:ElaB/YqjD/DUF883 family membrane-anchored ribosome-binding protein
MTDRNQDNSGAGQQRHDYTEDVRQRAIEAYDSARDTAYSAGRKASDAIEEAPLVALGAGIAAGALIAALLPTSRREREMLKPYGTKVTDAARDAADAARKVGSEKLQELGLMPDALLDKAGETVKTSAEAAVGTFREDVAGGQSAGKSAGAGSKSRKSGSQNSQGTGSKP